MVNTLLTKIGSGIVGLGMIVGSWFGFVPTQPVPQINYTPAPVAISEVVGAYAPSGGGTYRLKASAGTTDTSVNLSSFKEPVSNLAYTMALMNTAVAYGTIEPQIPGKSEFISFTGITQNSDGSAKLTGVSRGLTRSPQGSACSASTTLAVRHPAQSTFILSDSPCVFAEYAIKRNDETITGDWHVGTPVTVDSVVPKSFVTSLVNGGTVSTDSVIVSGTAGETITSGQILYFDQYQQEWMKADADFASTTGGTILGVAQGAGTNGNPITSGVLLRGTDTKNPGGTAGRIVYISNTAGATSTSVGTVERAVGQMRSASQFYFDPDSSKPNLTSDGKLDSRFLNLKTYTGQASTTMLTISGSNGNLYASGTSAFATTTTKFFGNLQQVFSTTSPASPDIGQTATEQNVFVLDIPYGLLNGGTIRTHSYFDNVYQTGACATLYSVDMRMYLGSTVINNIVIPIVNTTSAGMMLEYTIIGLSQNVQKTLLGVATTTAIGGAANMQLQSYRPMASSSASTVDSNQAFNFRLGGRAVYSGLSDAAQCHLTPVWSYAEFLR